MAEQEDAPAPEAGVLMGMLVQIQLAAPDLAHSANGRLRGFQLHNSGSIPLCAISSTAIFCSRSSILDRAPPREGGGLPVRTRPGALAASVFEEEGGI